MQISSGPQVGNARHSFSHVISLEIGATVFTLNNKQSQVERFFASSNQIKEAVSHPYLRGQWGDRLGREQTHPQEDSPGDRK